MTHTGIRFNSGSAHVCNIKRCRCKTRKADGRHVSLTVRDFERFSRGPRQRPVDWARRKYRPEDIVVGY